MSILTIISPLILIVLAGFITAKKSWLSKGQLDGISKLTFLGFIPSFLFYQMANADLSSQLDSKLFAAFYLPVLICYALGFIANYFFHHKHQQHIGASAVFALNASYSNNIIVGLPVLLLAVGETALPIIFIIVTFHSAMLFGITGALAANNGGFNLSNFITQNLKNPLIIGILSGLLFNISGLTLPDVIDQSLQLFSKPAVTLALFVLGASISFYKINQDKRFIACASALKLIILPSLVYLFASQVFFLAPLIVKVLVILSACPVGVNAYLIAKNYQFHQETVASSVVISTILSAITIPLWLTFLSH